MINYWLFAYRCYYPPCASHQYRGRFDSPEGALEWLKTNERDEDGNLYDFDFAEVLIQDLAGDLVRVVQYFNARSGWEHYPSKF